MEEAKVLITLDEYNELKGIKEEMEKMVEGKDTLILFSLYERTYNGHGYRKFMVINGDQLSIAMCEAIKQLEDENNELGKKYLKERSFAFKHENPSFRDRIKFLFLGKL